MNQTDSRFRAEMVAKLQALKARLNGLETRYETVIGELRLAARAAQIAAREQGQRIRELEDRLNGGHDGHE